MLGFCVPLYLLSSKNKAGRRGVPLVAALVLTSACASAGNAPPNPGIATSQVESGSDPIDAIIRMRVPGLIVNRSSDGGVALQISGPPASIDGDNVPLYLLDDSPFTPGPNGELTGINPADIASVKILKRAAAAIYGIRGANGVIVITTKRPAGRS